MPTKSASTQNHHLECPPRPTPTVRCTSDTGGLPKQCGLSMFCRRMYRRPVAQSWSGLRFSPTSPWAGFVAEITLTTPGERRHNQNALTDITAHRIHRRLPAYACSWFLLLGSLDTFVLRRPGTRYHRPPSQ
ncbi:hypothetical protein CH63R_06990 [Colletotrichum higginsianum IMI 349063]|uniref:Uncharacterized protein n=1 Tax=Colletotrichum higginsianum (strain IMI 349063) TaxID=759273 RepID=A0A1B7Y8H5_COLHI|nr:hypothetical protein CH63R_06990 [Colletotrichum higginsianum IMI 349063]OBR08225.1 hypothetical protein CH63R_06990 [Colletotrichum higginsianum IMI 349063]